MSTKRVVLITGASSGLGKLAASKFLDLGYYVYAAARRVELMEDLKAKGAHILKMDVTKIDTITAGVEDVIKEQGVIDILLNNAGYGAYGMIENMPIEEVQRQFDVNVFGMARVLNAVLPFMRKRRNGRIIFTSSLASHASVIGTGWYSSTKHALKAMAVALRQEVKDLGIEVVLIEPGTVKTGFEGVAFEIFDAVKPSDDYETLHKGFRKTMVDGYASSPSPETTVNAMIEAATSKKPKLVYRTTMDARVYPLLLGLLPDKVVDNVLISQTKAAAKK